MRELINGSGSRPTATTGSRPKQKPLRSFGPVSDDDLLAHLGQHGFPDGTDVGGGVAADGARWRLIMHRVHREAPQDEDLHFWLLFSDGGPGWSANTAKPPAPLLITNISTHKRAHMVCGLVTRKAVRVLGHDSEGDGIEATIIRTQFLPFDLFVASSPYPRWIAAVEAFNASGSSLGRTPDWEPGDFFKTAWAKAAAPSS
jgi:hypothetical protein